MGLHDQASIAGVTESCRYNDHALCNNPKCSCDCHIQAAVVKAEEAIDGLEQGKPEKACPTCGVKRPFRETFCRVDGSRLTSLVCAMCGSGGETGDKFCWKCGNDLDNNKLPGSLLQAPALEPEEDPEVDYAKQVLDGMQKELGSQDQGGEDGIRKVVETPMGEAGSFKLVSGPSPVKVRHPAPASESAGHPSVARAGSRSGFRLPVKPA